MVAYGHRWLLLHVERPAADGDARSRHELRRSRGVGRERVTGLLGVPRKGPDRVRLLAHRVRGEMRGSEHREGQGAGLLGRPRPVRRGLRRRLPVRERVLRRTRRVPRTGHRTE